MQIQNANGPQAMQAVRAVTPIYALRATDELCSFELGGEKKTKGAALTFVSHLCHITVKLLTEVCSPLVSVLCIMSTLHFTLHATHRI